MPSTATKRKRDDLEQLCARQQKALALGKKWYARADALMDEIEHQMSPGERAGKFELVDKFANRNRVNVGLNARRFELKEVDLPQSA